MKSVIKIILFSLMPAALMACATAPPKGEGPAVPKVAEVRTTTAVEAEYRALARTNPCPDGVKELQGHWRFIGQSKTPDFSDIIEIGGTRFTEKLGGRPDGRSLDVVLTGEVRCLFRNRVLMSIERVTVEGAYGNRSGDAYPCDILQSMEAPKDRMMMICYPEWDLRTAAGVEFEYARIVE